MVELSGSKKCEVNKWEVWFIASGAPQARGGQGSSADRKLARGDEKTKPNLGGRPFLIELLSEFW